MGARPLLRVIAAFNDTTPSIPPGMVGVAATIDGIRDARRHYFHVPAAVYAAGRDTPGGFVLDQELYVEREAIDPFPPEPVPSEATDQGLQYVIPGAERRIVTATGPRRKSDPRQNDLF